MNEYKELSDEELIVRLRNGETKIVDYIMDKYKNLVRGKAKAMFLIGGDNDDLIQEGMIGLFKAIRDYNADKDSSFFSFANLCVQRQMYSAIEASNRKKHIPLNSYVSFSNEESDVLDMVAVHHVENPEAMMIAKENERIINERMTKCLSKMEKEVMTLYIEGNNYREIAKILDKSPKSIDNALQRIRGKLSDLCK